MLKYEKTGWWLYGYVLLFSIICSVSKILPIKFFFKTLKVLIKQNECWEAQFNPLGQKGGPQWNIINQCLINFYNMQTLFAIVNSSKPIFINSHHVLQPSVLRIPAYDYRWVSQVYFVIYLITQQISILCTVLPHIDWLCSAVTLAGENFIPGLADIY